MKLSFQKYIAEFFGTMILVAMGCGSVVLSKGQASHIEISLCFGLTFMILFYAIEPVSGCHINPAVTVAMLVLKKIDFKNAIGYIISQCLGAIFGAAFLLVVIAADVNYDISGLGLGQNEFKEFGLYEYDLFVAFLAEVFFTAVFLVIILGTTNSKRHMFSGIIIGLALIVIHMVGIPITGVSVNPARSIGPALFVGGKAVSQLWVFIFAPITGALFGTLFWNIINVKKQIDTLVDNA